MVRNNSRGYLFEARKDIKGGYGLLEKFYLLDDRYRYPDFPISLRMTVGLNNKYDFATPYYNNTMNGFIPLAEQIEDNIEKFCKSHKPTFTIFSSSEATTLANMFILMNPETKEIGRFDFDLYTPKAVNEESKIFFDKEYKPLPEFICTKIIPTDEPLTEIDKKQGLKTKFDGLYEMACLAVKKKISYDLLKGREDYMRYRLSL